MTEQEIKNEVSSAVEEVNLIMNTIEKLSNIATYDVVVEGYNPGEFQQREPLFDEIERGIIKKRIIELIKGL